MTAGTPQTPACDVTTAASWKSAFSADGQCLFFDSSRKGTMGHADIWMCRKEGQGWSGPVNLGPEITWPHTDDDHSATILDGAVMYFARCYRPWNLMVTGRADSKAAIRHMADIYALGE